MKYLKKFENREDSPLVGDYVILNMYPNEITEILEVDSIRAVRGYPSIYMIKIFNPTMKSWYEKSEFLDYGTKKEMETIIQSKKYNL